MAGKNVDKAAELFLKRLQDKKRERKTGIKYLKLPDKLEVYEPEVGVDVFDILPFVTKSKAHKYVSPGDLWFEKTYFVHYGIGVDEAAFVCPKTERKPCPICEYRAKLLKSGDKAQIDIAKALRPKERQLFLIYHPAKKKVMVMAMSYHLFGKLLEEEVEASGDPSVAAFWSIDGGKSLRVRWGEGSMGGGKTFIEAKRIDFIDRKYKLKVPKLSLDDLLEILPYEELHEAFFEDSAEHDADEAPEYESVDEPVVDIDVDEGGGSEDSGVEVDIVDADIVDAATGDDSDEIEIDI